MSEIDEEGKVETKTYGIKRYKNKLESIYLINGKELVTDNFTQKYDSVIKQFKKIERETDSKVEKNIWKAYEFTKIARQRLLETSSAQSSTRPSPSKSLSYFVGFQTYCKNKCALIKTHQQLTSQGTHLTPKPIDLSPVPILSSSLSEAFYSSYQKFLLHKLVQDNVVFCQKYLTSFVAQDKAIGAYINNTFMVAKTQEAPHKVVLAKILKKWVAKIQAAARGKLESADEAKLSRKFEKAARKVAGLTKETMEEYFS